MWQRTFEKFKVCEDTCYILLEYKIAFDCRIVNGVYLIDAWPNKEGEIKLLREMLFSEVDNGKV